MKEKINITDETTTIKKIHEEWAKEHGYQDNETLNSQNTTHFKDGAER